MTFGSEWKFSQVFGEQNPHEDVQDCNFLSLFFIVKSLRE